MTRPVHFLLLFFLLSLCSYAQIGIKLSIDKERFLKYEPIEVRVTLRNYSGNTLIFGEAKGQKAQGRLLFNIKAHSGALIPPLSEEINPMKGIIFPPGESRELSLTLNTIYDLQKDDFYEVSAYIDHDRLPKAFESNSVSFEVREGTVIFQKTIGLPTEKNDSIIKSITASLLRFNDYENEVYCMRLEDENCVYGTFRIGPYISGSTPQMDADEASAIHVLVQVRPKLYSYTVYSIINGVAKLRQQKYYVPDNGIPTISRATGYIKILNARQAIDGTDFKFQEENRKPNYIKQK